MPVGSNQYTLVGFTPKLDWRKLSFVNPIPYNRICCICGVVRKKTVLLPCVHVLCDSCYQQCSQGGSHVCPLDGQECDDENDVEWMEFHADQLLKREVKCWNEHSGCQAVTTASEISRHFQQECEYHSVSCPRCTSDVLYPDLFPHLRLDCSTKEEPRRSESRAPCCCRTDEGINSLRASLEKQAAEIMLLLEKAAAESALRDEQLIAISHRINCLTETLIRQVIPETQQNHDILSRFARDDTLSREGVKTCLESLKNTMNSLPEKMGSLENSLTGLKNNISAIGEHFTDVATTMKAQVKENTEAVVEKIREILAQPNLQPAFTTLSVPGVKTLQGKALEKGIPDFYSGENVYLRGCCILRGITLEKKEDSVRCCAGFAICKGDLDDIVQWPFNHDVRLSVLHAKGGQKGESKGITNPERKYFQRPVQTDNHGVFYGDSGINLNELFTGGYLAKDMLRIKLELLPRNST